MSQIVQQWNLDSLYKGTVHSKELKDLAANIEKTLGEAEIQIHKYQAESDGKSSSLLVDLIEKFQYVVMGWEEFDDYSICVYAEDVTNPEVINLLEESAVLKSKLNAFQITLDQLFAEMPQEEWLELINLEAVRPLSFYLEERRERVRDQLPSDQERIINALSVNGIVAWSQQHELMLNKLKVPLEFDEENEEVSIGHALNEAIYAKEQKKREQAASALTQVCENQAESFAAVFNRIAGFRLDVYEQRGWKNDLKEMLEQNRIQEASIRAMLSSLDDNKELYRAYIKRKIQVDGLNKISWFDLESPSFVLVNQMTFDYAKKLITKQFYSFSTKLGEFADRAFEEGWIESEDRPNKAGGGFCASIPFAKQSRIFLTYRSNYQDAVTLAHELGHAYHNFILHEEPGLAQQKGTSVAESASTFMENLVLDAVIEQTENPDDKLAMLEMKIRDGLKYAVTVPNMFRFEREFYSKRKQGQLTGEEIKTLIAKVENEFYDGIVENLATHKWMYISHFYDAEKPFFNIPYTIGYLFSNGIYAKSQKMPEGFPEQYDALLRDSGRMTIEQLAQTYLGEDVTKKDFWSKAQESLKNSIEEYLQLTEKLVVR